MIVRRPALAVVALVGLLAGASCSSARAVEKLAGRLETRQGVSILFLHGTPRENGYAQGYLLAKRVTVLFENAFERIGDFAAGVNYEQLSRLTQVILKTSERERAEAEGIIAGIRDRLGPDGLKSKALGRELSADDVLNANALPDLGRMGCSSFAAWGSRTADGGPIVGRNLDYFGREVFSGAHVLVVRASTEPNRRGWVALNFAGGIGVGTVINDAGTMVATHDSGGLRAMPAGQMRCRGFIVRDLVESLSGSGDVPDQAARFCRREPTSFATNLLIAPPSGPAGVLEYDQDVANQQGVTLRRPAKGEDWIVVTNHYRDRAAPYECPRYESLAEPLAAGRKLASTADGWDLITRASRDGTLQTVVYQPSMHKILLSFSTATTPAHKVKPVEFDIEELYKEAKAATDAE
ncbi:MAG: hypothetical protein JW809_05950 [Pirellulales bacterium]|nr:hypothetical protein [Pirellulales bacterium]